MENKKTILVIGANGQLGNEMKVISSAYPDYDFLFVTREQLPIDDVAAVAEFFKQHTINFCVNCAAYTAVDKAETEADKAMHMNAIAVENLATICKNHHAAFVHISTDYVFDGTASVPYKEDFITNPVNTYGATKLKGEQLAIQHNPETIIIRTSWVYSSFGNNFVKTMLRLMKERDAINVVADQQGCPTYAADLADAIMQIVTKLDKHKIQISAGETIFNYSNQGVTTWCDFALAIKEISGSNCSVNPITTAAYPTPAKRPAYSVMDTSKIQLVFNIEIPQWKTSLKKCMALLT